MIWVGSLLVESKTTRTKGNQGPLGLQGEDALIYKPTQPKGMESVDLAQFVH